MTRLPLIAALLLASCLVPTGRVDAQQAWRTSVPGRPIVIVTSPPLHMIGETPSHV
jgi:NhaP-type Na+/H+ or K+/H+ antiporter